MSDKTLDPSRYDWLGSAQTKALMAMFAAGGHEARFVGGVVRNALLGEVVHDLDIATDARPEHVMELAQRAGFKAVGTGLKHGTVTLVVDDQVYEVTTLRVDVETDGRRAKVAFTDDWREDAARRDFTMNALYVDGRGRLFDPLDGYDDLMARRVRFIGRPDERISEDYLRILRFFRFGAQYGDGQMDKRGLAACVRLRGGLAGLSGERIGAEMQRLLVAPKAGEMIHIMYGHDLLLPLLGVVPMLRRFDNWLALAAQLGQAPDAVARLGALGVLTRNGADMIAARLRLSNRQKAALALWATAKTVSANMSEKAAHHGFYQQGDDFQMLVAINWLRAGADPANESWRKLYDLPLAWPRPVFPLKGEDLLALGLKSGPKLGKKLRQLEGEWIDSDFTLSGPELLERL